MLISNTELDSKGSRDLVPLECYQCGKTHYRTKNIILRILNGNHYGTQKGCFCSQDCKHQNRRIKRIVCQCFLCGKSFERRAKNIGTNVFCSHSCLATFYNKKRTTIKQCSNCKKDFHPYRKSMKYCSVSCKSHETKQAILEKIENGTYEFSWPKPYREYLILKYGATCMICGWDKINPKTKKCPIQLDHIDGQSSNNNLQNLRLLCPNCHSLTPTYMNLNKGNGRRTRRERYLRVSKK